MDNKCVVCGKPARTMVCSNKCAGSLGGRVSVPKGFAMMAPEERIEAGRKGGSISRPRGRK